MSAVAEMIGWLVLIGMGVTLFLACMILGVVIGVEAGDRIVERFFGGDKD